MAILLVLCTKSYRKPTRIGQIMFGLELPMMAFILARLIFLRTLTLVNILFLLAAGVSITAYLFYVFKPKNKRRFLQWGQLLAIQSAVTVGLYASTLMFFFVPIVLVASYGFLVEYFKYFSLDSWASFSGFLVLLAGGGLFISLVACPFVGLLLYWRASDRLGQQLNSHHQKIIRSAFSLGFLLILVLATYQSSLADFYNQIEDYRVKTTFESRAQIASSMLKHEKTIKKQLTNNYLAHYRYLTDQHMNVLQSAYEEKLDFSHQTAVNLQNLFIALARPFVHQGDFVEDVPRANQDYEDIFDEPIQLGESRRVAQTLRTSFMFDTDSLKSSVLDRESRDVHLAKRTVVAQPDQSEQFAIITIEEEYLNLTDTEQEVFYLFSLPPDSVVIDLKLGPDLNLKKYPLEIINNYATPSSAKSIGGPSYVAVPESSVDLQINHGEVAAKGAAQQTYEDQYRRRIDPAILEQVGPNQYKLRIYPIPVATKFSSTGRLSRFAESAKPQKMQFSYVAPIRADGTVTLPRFSEQRNIFIDHRSILVGQDNPSASQITAINRPQPVCHDQVSRFVLQETGATEKNRHLS